jgi:hypothetical protein
MKKLLLISLMCISTLTHAQKKFKQQDDAKNLGWIVTTGGVALTIGAAFTPNELSRVNGRWEPTPLYNEPARFAGVITGCAVTASGLITMLATMEPKNKRRR